MVSETTQNGMRRTCSTHGGNDKFLHRGVWYNGSAVDLYAVVIERVRTVPPLLRCAIALSRQHIITSTVFKLEAYGRAIAQAVSRWLPSAAARVRSQVMSCGICGGKRGTGAVFLRVLRFPLPILIPPTAP
jgi:hypothetical protein